MKDDVTNKTLKRFEGRYIPEPNTGCWLWIGILSVKGYGVFSFKNKKSDVGFAHRWSYEYFNGPIPEGYVIDHKCRQRCCVNPSHLRAVTKTVNSLENSLSIAALHAKQTHCKRGHLLSGNNLILKKGSMWRNCRICTNMNQRKNRSKYKARKVISGEQNEL